MTYNIVLSGDVPEAAVRNDVALIEAMLIDLRFRGLYKVEEISINVAKSFGGSWVITYAVCSSTELDRISDRISKAMPNNPVVQDRVTDFLD